MSELFQDDNNNNRNSNTKRRIFNNPRGRYLHPHSNRGSRSHTEFVLSRLGVTDLREHLERKKESDSSSPKTPPPDPSFNYLKDPLREVKVPDRELKRSQSYGKIEGKFNRGFTPKEASSSTSTPTKTKRSTKENRTNFQGREESGSSYLKNPYNIQIELKTESGERTYIIDETNKLSQLGPNPRHPANKTDDPSTQGYSNFKQPHNYSRQNFSNRGRGASRGRGAPRGRGSFVDTDFSQRPHFNKQHQHHYQHQNQHQYQHQNQHQYQPRNKKTYRDNNDQEPGSSNKSNEQESWDQEIAENEKKIKDEQVKIKQEVSDALQNENESAQVCNDDKQQNEFVKEDEKRRNVKDNDREKHSNEPSDSDKPRGIIAGKHSHEKKKKVTIKDS